MKSIDRLKTPSSSDVEVEYEIEIKTILIFVSEELPKVGVFHWNFFISSVS